MKHLTFPRVALVAAMCIVASAAGVDLQAFALQHQEAFAAASMLAGGTIDVLVKSLDKIEGKFNEYENQTRELADRMLQLEQKKGTFMPGEGSDQSSDGIGSKFIKAFEENRELFEKTRSVRLEIKAAGDTIGTTSGRQVVTGGVGVATGAVIGFQNALTSRPASNTSAVEYSRYTGQQGAAAQQAAEGDAKAAVRPDHSLIVQTALTIAGYSKMSRQALSDSAELRRSVEIVLRRSVGTALDVALVNGATGFTGFEGLANAYTSLVYTGMADAISEGVSTMQLAGFAPDVVGLNPADWLAVITRKGTANDHYLSGNYLGAMPSEMRGLRVVLSPSVNAGSALLADTGHSELLMGNGFMVEVAYSGDDFTKNLVTILGELRVIPTFRTTGSMRLITPKA